MPQKKNSWSLSWIRGQASIAIGRLSGVFTILKAESDGLEDTLLGPWQLYETLDEAEDMAAMLAGIIATMTVNTERLAATAGHGWTQATDLAAMLTQQAKISWREAHQVVAHLVRESVDAGTNPEDVGPSHVDKVAERLLGRPLKVTPEAVRTALDPRQSLDSRQFIEGSPAPARVEAQIKDARAALAEDEARIATLADKTKESGVRLESAIDAILAGRLPEQTS
jgi:argininosuccinate lyase